MHQYVLQKEEKASLCYIQIAHYMLLKGQVFIQYTGCGSSANMSTALTLTI